MIRTKYLVIVLMFGITIVLVGGVFFVHGIHTSAPAFAGETFFTVPQDRYDVSPITEKNYDSERKHFIEKVKNALVGTPRQSDAEGNDTKENSEVTLPPHTVPVAEKHLDVSATTSVPSELSPEFVIDATATSSL